MLTLNLSSHAYQSALEASKQFTADSIELKQNESEKFSLTMVYICFLHFLDT